ncbi:MAG: hypothetical protein M3436_14780 [Pseudomonadota bacterium]|nr:hypothetical protein [Pseudomonadota bacterium]
MAAIALERIHFVSVAQDTLIKMESERLRNTLLAALSHDLRIYMGHLRQKREDDPGRAKQLITETGIGYRFVPA